MEQETTANKILVKESYVEINFDPATQIITAKWKGYLRLDQVKKGCEFLSDIIERDELTRHLSDHRELKVLSKEVQDYLTQSWFGDVESRGLRGIAVLVSEDVFAQATVNKVNNEQARVGKMVINTYNSEQDCRDWLTQV